MAPLRDSLLRTIRAEIDAGRGIFLALRLGAKPPCCTGMADGGMLYCTCWTVVYDVEQQSPDAALGLAIGLGKQDAPQRDRMCGDCAYRPDSPEKSASPAYRDGPDELERLARDDRFWCHDGMRQPKAWLHPPSRVRLDAVGAGDYQPPVVAGVPWRADGRPGLLCAGWAARRRALTAESDTS
jgi:hypothetical protein